MTSKDVSQQNQAFDQKAAFDALKHSLKQTSNNEFVFANGFLDAWIRDVCCMQGQELLELTQDVVDLACVLRTTLKSESAANDLYPVIETLFKQMEKLALEQGRQMNAAQREYAENAKKMVKNEAKKGPKGALEDRQAIGVRLAKNRQA